MEEEYEALRRAFNGMENMYASQHHSFSPQGNESGAYVDENLSNCSHSSQGCMSVLREGSRNVRIVVQRSCIFQLTSNLLQASTVWMKSWVPTHLVSS